MNRRILGLAVLGLALGSSVALARNFHCAGGIQYVIQGTKEKDKGNLDDARRIFGKAVAQLTECTTEDPTDSESWEPRASTTTTRGGVRVLGCGPGGEPRRSASTAWSPTSSLANLSRA